MILKIGLTGSIAVGKSYVCNVLRQLGCFVFDADQAARDVVQAGSSGFAGVVAAFGRDIVGPDGEIDRPKLGAIVFRDAEKRQLLNSIVHPLVIDLQDRWITSIKAEKERGIAVVEAALMIESGGYRRFDKLVVVWCEPAIQLQRLMLRGNLNPSEAALRVAAQMPQHEKKKFADFLIDTSSGYEDARRQTVEVYEKLAALV